jgi:hypothetical protein
MSWPIRPRATHCVHGHEFTVDNTRVRENGSRQCRACVSRRGAEHYRAFGGGTTGICTGCGAQYPKTRTNLCRSCRSSRPHRWRGKDPADRFFELTLIPELPNACWPWGGSRDRYGYGKMSAFGVHVRVYRYSYELLVGPIPEGLTIDHLCRNPPCVNPDHLEAVTNKENILRSDSPSAINARKTHCIHGHEFTEANTYVSRQGVRTCRTCGRLRNAAAEAAGCRSVPCRQCGVPRMIGGANARRDALCRKCAWLLRPTRKRSGIQAEIAQLEAELGRATIKALALAREKRR